MQKAASDAGPEEGGGGGPDGGPDGGSDGCACLGQSAWELVDLDKLLPREMVATLSSAHATATSSSRSAALASSSSPGAASLRPLR